MAGELNQQGKPMTDRDESLSATRMTHLFRQITHDIRVPVTGLKMLWPMLEETDEQEKEEIFEYLKHSSYELFGLIENLSTLLMDHEMLTEESAPSRALAILSDLSSRQAGKVRVQTSIPKDVLVPLRSAHFQRCLELAFALSAQAADEADDTALEITLEQREKELLIRFVVPGVSSLEDEDLEVHYSLFDRAKGNSGLSGFLLLRLRNLLEMLNGELMVDADKTRTQIILHYPVD